MKNIKVIFFLLHISVTLSLNAKKPLIEAEIKAEIQKLTDEIDSYKDIKKAHPNDPETIRETNAKISKAENDLAVLRKKLKTAPVL